MTDAEQYPRGKLTPDDDGAIEIQIGTHRHAVVLHFGKAVTWIGFDAEAARMIAAAIVQKADELAAAEAAK